MAIDNNLELFDSQEATHSRTGSNQERKYLLTGTEDTDEAAGFAAVNLPATVPGLFGSTLSLQDFRIAHQGGGVHEVSAKYASQAPERNFEVGGGQTRITQSRKTLRRYASPGKTAPNFNQGINVTADNVEGVEIGVSSFSFVEKYYFPRAAVNADYEDTLSALVDRVNDDEFRSYGPGEVLLKQVSGSQRGIEDVELTFRFEVSRDEVGVRVGDIGVVDYAKSNFGDVYAEDDPVFLTPGGLAVPDAGATNNRLLDVAHVAAPPGDTTVQAGGPLEKETESDLFVAGVPVYLTPVGTAALTVGGGANVAIGLAQANSLPGEPTVDIFFVFTKADPDQSFDVDTPLWVRPAGTADNRAVFDANTILGKAYVASIAGAATVRVMTIDKGGWEYLWVSFLADTSENHLIRTPTSVQIERVYLSGDFSKLGIGTGPR
jgi:hypothetical protein